MLYAKGAFAWRATLDGICPSTFFGTRPPVSLFGRVDVATSFLFGMMDEVATFFVWLDGKHG
jgi:hypothetical protein